MKVPDLNAETSVGFLREVQDLYDREFWQHYGSDLEDIRHVGEHLGKLIGKLFTPVEAMEHGVSADWDQLDGEVIPDLLLWALHLANSRGLRLEELYHRRLEENIKKLHS